MKSRTITVTEGELNESKRLDYHILRINVYDVSIIWSGDVWDASGGEE